MAEQKSSSCPWLHTPPENVKFINRPYKTHKKIYNDVLEVIGNTPLVRLNKIPQSFGLKCEFLVKCDFYNPGGSVKDRIGARMVQDAEEMGRIKPGATLIEATSGNAGIGLALAAAVKGYKMIITLPEKMSQEKVNVLKGLGAEIIRTPTEASFNSPESHIGVAKTLQQKLENAHILDQYNNPSNPIAHYDQTGEEIVDQCDGKLDYYFGSLGTGGTMTGVASKLKEKIPGVKCIGIDPVGSILAQPEDLNTNVDMPYKVEGIGYDFIPNTCVRSFVDGWVKTWDKESFEIARRLIKEEGLLVGGSCGSTVWGAIKYCVDNKVPDDARVVVLLPDSVRNYMTKFLSDDWMIDNHFLSHDTYLDKESKSHGKTAKDLGLEAVKFYDLSLTVGDALEAFEKGADTLVVVHEKKVLGVLYESKFISAVQTKKLGLNDSVKRALIKEFGLIQLDTDLSIAQRYLDRHPTVVVEEVEGDAVSKVYLIRGRDLIKFHKN